MKQARKKAYFKDFLRSGLLLLDYSVPNLNRYSLIKKCEMDETI